MNYYEQGQSFLESHGSHIGFDNNIYLTDNGDHTVRKFTLKW